MTLQNLWFDRLKGMVSPCERYGLATSYHTYQKVSVVLS